MPRHLEPPGPHPHLRAVAAAVCFAGFCAAFLLSVRGPSGPEEKPVRQTAEVPRLPAGPPEPEPAGPAPDPGQPPPVPDVLIDPGHGGGDGGTVANGLIEKDWTLKIGQELARELRQRGHQVALTRTSDVTVPLDFRWQLANSGPRIALISIHANAGPPEASGVETFYSWPRKPEVMARLHGSARFLHAGLLPDDSESLALAVQAAAVEATGSRDRGVRNRLDLAMTSRTLCPSILVECGFLTNAGDAARIQEAAFRARIVGGIADGYESWLRNRPDIPAGNAGPPVFTGSPGGDLEH